MDPSFHQKSAASDGGLTRVWLVDPKGALPGAFSMHNTLEFPNDAAVCLLSDVLETDPIPSKYYLSPRACLGILRRAEKRGKTLPPALRQALATTAEAVPEEMEATT
uniref:Uncharacterized protein n=1 Tax=viral metagenome TaxID=1070528 RepID=A0A6M3XWS4_9ZZZZ